MVAPIPVPGAPIRSDWAQAVGVALASGTATIPAPAGPGTPATISVTFPASRFGAAPVVVVSAITGNPSLATASPNGITASGFTATGARFSGTMATIPCAWIAHQMT